MKSVFVVLVCLFCLFRAQPVACGGSQARGQMGAVAAGLPHTHSNATSLTHRVRSGIELMSSWILAGWLLLSHDGNSGRCRLLDLEWMGGGVLLYSTGNCVQTLRLEQDKKEKKKKKKDFFFLNPSASKHLFCV